MYLSMQLCIWGQLTDNLETDLRKIHGRDVLRNQQDEAEVEAWQELLLVRYLPTYLPA